MQAFVSSLIVLYFHFKTLMKSSNNYQKKGGGIKLHSSVIHFPTFLRLPS